MRVEIPYCTRCCFILPLRLGIIILGYINLLFSILVVSIEKWLGMRVSSIGITLSMYKGFNFDATPWLTIFLYILEIIFNIVLIIGAHLKRIRLIRVYYYYGVTTILATFVSYLYMRLQNVIDTVVISEICLAFIGMAVHVYLLALIRSEMNKRRYHCGGSYVNYITEVTFDPPAAWNESRTSV
ncbi:hypothetical protein K1T71_012517 [Dendrolimus kikuchii]|uniref:Uncharacterized protein n=1 Tax=Dendrolimus kikuchii TaxID=765133 RepID=A0ACC1CJK1_9NEOP|nr:hypothetical protein K1T71_012517 [Dendrolimus kikuchii]